MQRRTTSSATNSGGLPKYRKSSRLLQPLTPGLSMLLLFIMIYILLTEFVLFNLMQNRHTNHKLSNQATTFEDQMLHVFRQKTNDSKLNEAAATVSPQQGKQQQQKQSIIQNKPRQTVFIDFMGCRSPEPENITQKFDCDVPCFVCGAKSLDASASIFISNHDNNITRKFPSRYTIAHKTMENYSPKTDVPIDHMANHSNHTDLYATTSFNSDIPLPYYSKVEYPYMQHPHVDFSQAIKGASFINRNCNSKNHREDIVKDLTKHIRVDAVGSCLHNMDIAQATNGTVTTLDNKTEAMEKYLFHFAFENSRYDDYITEKLWGSLQSGTLPVYLGPSNIRHHLPHPKCVISVDDFSSTHELGLYLNEVSQNRTLWESYHAWRSQPLPKWWNDKYSFTTVHSTCRMCRYVYAKENGLEWDKKRQEIVW